MLILKNISETEKEKILNGNLLLLSRKLEEAEKVWSKKLLQGKDDHRHTQGVYCLLSDIMELIPTIKTK